MGPLDGLQHEALTSNESGHRGQLELTLIDDESFVDVARREQIESNSSHRARASATSAAGYARFASRHARKPSRGWLGGTLRRR
jgi:hypothetical protein